jgi:hypothetical protein
VLGLCQRQSLCAFSARVGHRLCIHSEWSSGEAAGGPHVNGEKRDVRVTDWFWWLSCNQLLAEPTCYMMEKHTFWYSFLVLSAPLSKKKCFCGIHGAAFQYGIYGAAFLSLEHAELNGVLCVHSMTGFTYSVIVHTSIHQDTHGIPVIYCLR